MEPLAVATNIAQSAHCRLDQVLLMFGLLHHRYTTLKDQQPKDERACNAILESLERCWAKADQDVFIAAVILNPLHKIAPFVKSVLFSVAYVSMCYYLVCGFASTRSNHLRAYKLK